MQTIEQKKDFFFNMDYFSLSNIKPIADKVTDNFFTAQLNRILHERGGRLKIEDAKSSPRFWSFIDKVATEQIGWIEIYAQNNTDKVIKSIACDIWLFNGVITINADWCAYNDVKLNELIGTLLIPLHLKNLQNRTHIRWSNKLEEPLLRNNNHQGELDNILKLTKEAPTECRTHAIDLECATRAGQTGFQSEKLWAEFRNQQKRIDNLEYRSCVE